MCEKINMAKLNMVEALNQALMQEMKRDKRVLVMGEDVGKEGGVFRVTAGLQKKFGKDRAIDTPLAEAGIVGTALGLAVGGMRPVVECQFDGFIYPAFQELVSHVSRLRNRSRGRYTCPLVLRAPYSGGIRALEHHSESMEALYAHVPGLKVVIPSTPNEAKGLLIASIRDENPVIFLEPKKVYRANKEEVSQKLFEIELSKARVVVEGDDVTIICYGAMLYPVLSAVTKLQQNGTNVGGINNSVSCEVIDLRTISPMDTETIVKSVEKTGRCVIVHEGPRSFGVGAEICVTIMEKCLLSLKSPVERVTGFDTIMPLYQNELNYIPDDYRVLKAVKKVLG